MTTNGARPLGQMRTLRNAADRASEQDGVDIILVPGVGTVPPDQWPFNNEQWLSTLARTVGSVARVIAYEYNSPFTTDKPSWESMLLLGYDFLQKLSSLRPLRSLEYNEDSIRPLVVICHSLGGLVVKQALCVANNQFHRYGSIISTIAGVVFLSTPHARGVSSVALAQAQNILEATSGKSLKIASANVEQEGTILLDLSARFESISFRTPMLSVFELRESKNNATPLLPRYQLLVDREGCSTAAPLEAVFPLNLNHHDICCFTQSLGGEGLPEFMESLHEILRNARKLVSHRLEHQEYQYATMSSYSPTTSEMLIHDLDLDEWPSNQATEWPSIEATEGTSASGYEMVYPGTPNVDVSKHVKLPCMLLSMHVTNEDFCGRSDVLEMLERNLLPSLDTVMSSGAALRQFALCGFGGVGKTEIAREFTRKHRKSFDAVFWINADEIAKLDHHYQQISLALGLENASECSSQVVSRETVKGWLSNPQKQASDSDKLLRPGSSTGSEASWLIIFDNADDPLLLADYWPQGSGSILLTSRDPMAKTIFTQKTCGMDLSPLTSQESLRLFNRLTGSAEVETDGMEKEGEGEQQDMAQKITNALGGVPLAISQMAGIIRRQDLTLSEFFELYADHEEHTSLYETKFDTNLIVYPHSISTVWAFEKLKPQARQMLEFISFLDPDMIGEDLLTEACAYLFSNKEGVAFKKSSYLEARADLLQSSLVQRDKQQHKLSVHRIVQDAVLSTMNAERKKLIFAKVVHILWANWPSAMPRPSKEPTLPQPKSTGGRLHVGRWPVCAGIYPHVLKLHQRWATISAPAEATRMHFAKLLNEAAWYQKERGHTRGFDGFFDTARDICETSTHADRDCVLADIFFCLGSVSMDQSDWASSRIYKEKSFDLVYRTCQELGKEDERLYLAYAERGISRTQDRRFEEAEVDLKEAIRMRKSFGNYVPRSGEANLSYSLVAQGKLQEAHNLLLESLEGRERALGKNDKESARTGLILYAMGNLYAIEEHWDESFNYHQRALKHMRATVGDKDFYTANAMHKVAEHLVRRQSYEEAFLWINAAIEVWSVEPTTRKNEIARTTFLKAKLFEMTGKTQKASIALRVAHRLRKEIVSDDIEAKTLTMKDFDNMVAFWAQ